MSKNLLNNKQTRREKSDPTKIRTTDLDRKYQEQEKYPHTMYTIRCASCSKVLGSEVLHSFPLHSKEIDL